MLEFLILLFAEIGVSAEVVYFAYAAVQAYGAYAAIIAYSVYGSVEARRKAAAEGRKQRADYNSNLSDRAITTLQSSPPFRVVYGRAIVGGDILGVFTSDKSAFHDDGTAYTKPDGYKHVVVHIASHAVHSIRDTLISGIRVGTLSGGGWATNTALGTGKNYTVASATCFVGTTSIPIVNGTGTILAGDEVSFTGDDNRYPVVTGVTGPGTIVIASPGLLVAAPVGAEVVLGNEFCKLKTQTRSISIPASGSVTVIDKISSVVITYGPSAATTDAQDAPIVSNATVDSSGLVISNPNAFDVTVTCIAAPLVSSVRISYHLGSSTQAVDAFLNSVVPNEWTTNHRLQGLSYAVITFDLEEQRFQGGIPQLSFDVEGKEILDTRTSTVAYSTNPALIIRDFLTAQDYGFQCKSTDIDVAALNAAANACDVSTNYQYIDAFGATISKSEALFTCNGSFTSDSSRESVLNDLCESMAGFATYGAQWSIQAGAWTAPVMTLNDADLDGQIDIVQAGAGLDTLFNGTRGTYIPAGKISAVDFLPYQNASFLTADSGVELWNNVTYPYTDSKYRCEQLARIMTERNRYGQVITYPGKLKAWPLVVGDRVIVNSTEYGFASKTYRVTDWQFTLSSAVGLVLQEETASVYDMVNATVADLSPASTLPNPNVVETLTGLTAVSGTTTLKRFVDGTIVPQVKVSWTMPKGAYLSGGQGEVALSWRRASGSTWDTLYPAADDRSVFIGNVVDLTTIIIEAYFINSNASAGNPMTITHLVLGKSQKPSNVTSLTYTPYPGRALVKFAACPDLDYSSVCVQVGSWSDSAAMFFEGDVSEYSYSNAAGTYTLYFKFRDTTGNLSTTVASITVAVPVTLVANLAALTGAESILNTQQQWAQVQDGVGTRPADNATVGAQAGTNLKDSGGTILADAAIKNSAITLNSSGNLSGAGGGAVTLGGLGTTGVVGGGNICVNGDFLLSSGGVPTNFGNYNNGGISVTNSVNVGGPLAGTNFWRITNNAAVTSTWGFYFASAVSAFGGWKANTNYVVSFYARMSANPGSAAFLLTWNSAPATQTTLQNPVLQNGVWQRYVFLVNFGSSTIDGNGFFYINPQSLPSGNNLDFACVQVEQGDIASGFAVAPLSNANPLTTANKAQLGYTGDLNATQNQSDATTNGAISTAGTTATWGGVTGSGKPADNATVGAAWGSNLTGKPPDSDLLNTFAAGGVTIINHPAGGNAAFNSSGQIGAIKIRLPQSWTNTMLRFFVEVYEYSVDRSFTLEVGGYNYSPTPSWYNCYAKLVGSAAAERTVRFGHDGTYCCVWIGEPGSVWEYPQIVVTGVRAGYSNQTASLWGSGWAISLDTSAVSGHAITGTVSNPLTGASWTQIPPGTGKAADNATVGATWGSNLTGQPANSALLNSLQEWADVQNTGGTRPANNATVGAPAGTNVGSTLAQTVEANAANALTNAAAAQTTANTANTAITGSFTAGAISDISGTASSGTPKFLGSRTASASGGTTPYKYQWSIVSQNNVPITRLVSITGVATATVSVNISSFASGNEANTELQCVITDANGRTVIGTLSVGVVGV